MKAFVLFLATLAAVANAGTYDDLKAQIQALAQQGNSGSASSSVNRDPKWIPDDEYYKTHYKNGKKKGFLGKMFDKVKNTVKGINPFGKSKKKSEEPAPITLNDYTQENHVHFHKDDHYHREIHQHRDYNRNYVNSYPSYYDYYRLKRGVDAQKRLHKNGVAAKKP